MWPARLLRTASPPPRPVPERRSGVLFIDMAPPCCRCNGKGKCRGCVCCKIGTPCVNCLPSKRGTCENGSSGYSVDNEAVPPADLNRLPTLTNAPSPRSGEDVPVAPPRSPDIPPLQTQSIPPLPTYSNTSTPNFVWGDLDAQTFVSRITVAYDEVVHWRRNIFMVPSGNIGCSFC